MRLKRIAYLLVLILILSLGISAYAENDRDVLSIDNSDQYAIQTELNNGMIAVIDPIYEDVQDPEDMAVPASSARAKLKAKLASGSSVPSFEDIDEAGDYLREQIKARTSKITIQLATEATTQSELASLQLEWYYNSLSHNGNPDEGDYLRWNLSGYTYVPDIAYSDGYATFSITPNYLTSFAQEEAVTEEVNRLMEIFSFDDETSDYQKFRTIYDYLCQNITYDESKEDDGNLRHSTYAALIKKTAVCQGYATAFYRLALTSGLNTRLITGTGVTSEGPENHGWNIVEIDGKWYQVDATWDSGRWEDSVGYIYCLCGSDTNSFPNHTPGVTKEGKKIDLPEEWDLLSEENYDIPLEILKQPESQQAYWGDSPSFRVAAIGKDLTYYWTVNYATGGQWHPTSAGIKLGGKTGINSSNRDRYDGATLSCTITDGAGNTVTTDTVKCTVHDPVADFTGYTLSFDGDIAINFYMDLSENVLKNEDSYLHFTIPGETEKTVDVPVSEGKARTFTIDGEKVTYYRFTAGVAAKDMTQKVHAEFYYDDSTVMTDQYYTVKEYADYIQDHPETYSDKAIDMVKAMLNYGGYAQVNFDYHTDELANADLEDTSLPEKPDLDSYAYTQEGSLEGVVFEGARLVLRTNTIIRLYFEMDGDLSDYTVTVDGTPVTPTESSLGDNWYMVEISGIPAQKLDRSYAVKITKDDSEESLEVNYSAYSNIKSVVENPDQFKETEVDMMKAMYVFGVKTKAYFAKG